MPKESLNSQNEITIPKKSKVTFTDSIGQKLSKQLTLKGPLGSGGGGCEGFLSPATLNNKDQSELIQFKLFYKETYDDKGIKFTQDPNLKVEESYQALVTLNKLGFKTVPFFGIIEFPNGLKALAVSDLSQGGKLAVHDEKHFTRNNKFTDSISNILEIKLDYFKTELLCRAHNIYFGVIGTASSHMLAFDSKTNTGKLYISDVGEFYQGKETTYRQFFKDTDIFKIPDNEISQIYQKILKKHLRSDIQETVNPQLKSYSRKKEFQDLFFQLAVGLSLSNPRVDNNRIKSIKKRYTKNKFSNDFLVIKENLESIESSFRNITGYDLFSEINDSDIPESERFFDQAYRAVIDSKIISLIQARESIDNNDLVIRQNQTIRFNRLSPVLKFFDTKQELKNPTFSEKLYSNIKSTLFKKGCTLSVCINWEQKRDIDRHFYGIVLLSEQIKRIKRDSFPTIEVDPEKIFIVPNKVLYSDHSVMKKLGEKFKPESIYYFYKFDDKIIPIIKVHSPEEKQALILKGDRRLILDIENLPISDIKLLVEARFSIY
jgi:hypothetical protein